MTLRESLSSILSDALSCNPRIEKFLDKKVEKEFSISFNKPWIYWTEFGTHKNVSYWYIVEGGYAIGHNESPSRGWYFPIKKLSDEQYTKYMAHTLTYEQFHNITE